MLNLPSVPSHRGPTTRGTVYAAGLKTRLLKRSSSLSPRGLKTSAAHNTRGEILRRLDAQFGEERSDHVVKSLVGSRRSSQQDVLDFPLEKQRGR